MQKSEKRKNQRISSINLLNYVSLDENYQEVSQGMGKTINMSETGILIETPSAINPEHFLSLNIGLKNERFKVHGQVVYTAHKTGANHRTGIRFSQAPKAGYYVFRNILNSIQNGIEFKKSKSTPAQPLSSPPLIKGPTCNYLYVADEETYLHGEKIITQGSYGNWVWVVLDGWAIVVRETQNDKFPIFKLGPGAFIGSSMSYLMSNHARTNSVIASGKIQLGLLDTERMIVEHSALSPEFKSILKSLSGRSKRIIDRIVSIKQGTHVSKEDLLSGNVIFTSDQKTFGLQSIIRGKATMLHQNIPDEIPYVNLYPGDYIGSLPFAKNGSGLNPIVVRSSTGLEMKEYNRASLLKEYENLSQTLKNMIEFTSRKILTGSQIVEQMMTKKLHIN